MNPSEQKQLYDLITLSIDGNITPAQFSELKQMLRSSQEAVRYYVAYMSILGDIRSSNYLPEKDDLLDQSFDQELWNELAAYEKTAPEIEIPVEKTSLEVIQKVVYPPREKRKISKINVFTLIVSAAAMLFIILFIKYAPENKSVYEVATLNAAVGARWSDSDNLLKSGDRICAGETFFLDEGLLEIVTDNGVDLILEGPAEFDFKKEGDLSLERGKVYAIVPTQGIGFTVNTPTSKIIDLGTEFGVEANTLGSTETHVYKGKVTLMASNSSFKKSASAVTEGQARLIKPDGTIQIAPVDNHLFVQKEEFMVNIRASQGSGYDRWLAYSYKLRRNPDLVAYYTFEKDESQPDVLENKAIVTEGRLNGELYSALGGPLPSWTKGRWPQKSALHFNRSDRQVVVVPSDKIVQINGPITLAAWVRCSEPKEGGHIVSCRQPNDRGNYQFGYKSPRPEDEWTGKLQFARVGDSSSGKLVKDRVFSEQTFDISPQWRFVAVTHDDKTVKFYVDGRYIESHDFDFQQAPVNAELVIGADRVEGDPTRFKGDMDELMIFNRVLNTDEIGEIYQSGQP